MISCYVETKAKPLFHIEGFRRRKISEGSVIGSWRCIFMFRFGHSLPQLPNILCLSSYTYHIADWSLESNLRLIILGLDQNLCLIAKIPTLANDLKFISELKTKGLPKISDDQEQCSGVEYGKCDQPKPEELLDCEVDQPKPRKIVLNQDLNCLPD